MEPLNNQNAMSHVQSIAICHVIVLKIALNSCSLPSISRPPRPALRLVASPVNHSVLAAHFRPAPEPVYSSIVYVARALI